MSIPKEPRQLMINLMYLVLTALLALNVSAEVMNAFFTLEKSMKVSNEIVTESNTKVLAAIKAEADAYKTDTTKQEVLAKAQQAVAISDEFDTYMEGVYQKIFDEAGGEDPKKTWFRYT
jgi:DNA-binding NarL/FixJ family response regulator